MTAETYSDRILKESATRIVPATTVHFFSGNNIGPRKDTASRSLMIRLEVDRPDPENRTFSHNNPFQWTLDHRGEILRAMYVILLGNEQLQPGKAKKTKTRFPEWWNLIGSAVETAATALIELQSPETPDSQKAWPVDFGEAVAAVQAEDEDDISTGRILDIFYRRWPGISFQAADVAKFIGSNDRAWEEDIQQLCSFFDPTGRRGTEIPATSIGIKLKPLRDGPVFAGDLELTLTMSSASLRKPAWFAVKAKTRPAG